MAIGTAAMWWNKHLHGAKHFTTWHSWFGVATVVWVVLQAAIGAGSVWWGGKAFGGGAKAKRVYKYHRWVQGYHAGSSVLM
jgi:cytochrome b-561 domain-containing protein 2